MKRIFALLLCAALITGCSTKVSIQGSAPAADSAAAPPSSQATAEQTSLPTQQPTATPAPAGMPLTGLESANAVSARPVAVMVSNTAGAKARQWGIADAGVVMEALTEGRDTNLMLWYASAAAVPKVGPVAQGKDVFWQFALPENSILVQKGAARYAENLLNCYAWQPIDAQNTGTLGFAYDESDPAAADENCWYTDSAMVQDCMNRYGMAAEGNVPQWLSFQDAALPSEQQVAWMAVDYSSQAATVFQNVNGSWVMCHADSSPYVDMNTGTQPVFRNVLILYCSAGVKDDGYTRDYDLSGGNGLYFVDGTWQPIRWQKGDAASPLRLYAADGTTLHVARGQTYVGIYGGFSGQSITVADLAGAAVDTGLAAPSPMAVEEPAAVSTPEAPASEAPAPEAPASQPAA